MQTDLKILLTGSTGQIGFELKRSLRIAGDIIAPNRSELDLTNVAMIRDFIRAVRPNLIINAAAWTAVDTSEDVPSLAMRINGYAPAIMAEEAKKIGAAMVHYSTDYVFDGAKAGPYVETDAVCPINVYGRTKLVAEQAIQATGIPYLILRTSWVYGARGKNFALSILEQAQHAGQLNIVEDQYGTPTWCRMVADITANVLHQMGPDMLADIWRERSAIYHLTARGQTTWYDFAKAILAQSASIKMPEIVPIKAVDLRRSARRPINSVLSCERLENVFSLSLPSWKDALPLSLSSHSVHPVGSLW